MQNDHGTINQRTAMFHSYIIKYLKDNNLDIDAVTLTTINEILYLINANYYYKISINYHLNREELIDLTLTQIISFLHKTSPKKIYEEDIKIIINNCSFISSNLRASIIKESSSIFKIVSEIANHTIENGYPASFKNEDQQQKVKKISIM